MCYMKWSAVESSISDQKLCFFVNSLIRKLKSHAGTREELFLINSFCAER